jgi:hypothetical protein
MEPTAILLPIAMMLAGAVPHDPEHPAGAAATHRLAKCTGADPCHACTNCKSCAHCKGGGECGACKKKPAPSVELWRGPICGPADRLGRRD